MPKMKTHSGAKKRFKTSGSGKLVRRKQGRNHILEKKSAKRTRRLALEGEISKADLSRFYKMLGKYKFTVRGDVKVARVKRSVAGRKSRKATLEKAKGYYGNKSRSYRAANEQVMHSGNYAFRDRRARKGEFRRLWIQRINAAARQNGTSYSKLVNGLNAAGVQVDRKILSDMAVNDPEAFSKLVEKAESARQTS